MRLAPLALAGLLALLPGAPAPAQTGGLPPSVAATSPEGALYGLVLEERQRVGVAGLTRHPLLDAVAAEQARALALGGGRPDGNAVLAALHRQRYIPMQDAVLAARAGDDPLQVLDILVRDPDTGFALANPVFQEIGLARVPNPRTQGPNDAQVWVLVLAKPLRAAPEQ